VIVYPLDRLYEEIAYIAHHWHWSYDQILQMDHSERRGWVDQIADIYAGHTPATEEQ
jgi:hypothetical protein